MVMQYDVGEKKRRLGGAGGMGNGLAERGRSLARAAGEIEPQTIARGLGWFSIGLGIAELLAPRLIAEVIGAGRSRPGLIRLMGVREIGHGVGILGQSHPREAVWSRVGGDALDLTLLGMAMACPGTDRGRLTAAAGAVAGVAALDTYCAVELERERADGRADEAGIVHVFRSVTVNQPPDMVYAFWRDFRNLPKFMDHLEAVQELGEGRSHWRAKAPLGGSAEWDAMLTDDRPGELIAWRSVEGSDIENAGSVRFQPLMGGSGGRATVVSVELRYSPPAGRLGAAAARLLGEEPRRQVAEDLRRFKQVMETGEAVSAEGPRGRCSG